MTRWDQDCDIIGTKSDADETDGLTYANMLIAASDWKLVRNKTASSMDVGSEYRTVRHQCLYSVTCQAVPDYSSDLQTHPFFWPHLVRDLIPPMLIWIPLISFSSRFTLQHQIIIIIIIIIIMHGTMFIVLSSPGSSDECRPAPVGTTHAEINSDKQ